MPLVTVAMPVYNDAPYVGEAIRSILGQTLRDLELLVVDDGSTDATPDILAACGDRRIRVLRHSRNLGCAVARNTALDAADSIYFAWMDADDLALPCRLERQCSFLGAHMDVSICGAGIQLFHQARGDMTFPADPLDIQGTTVFHPALCNPVVMMRLADIRAAQLSYDTAFSRAQDFVFWCDALLKHGLKAVNLRDVLHRYRFFIRPDSAEWHLKALRQHVMPALGLACTEDELALHTALVYQQRTAMVRRYGVEAIFTWLERLATHCRHQNLPFAHVVLRCARQEAERTIAWSPHFLSSFRRYNRCSLAKHHAAWDKYGITLARWLKARASRILDASDVSTD